MMRLRLISCMIMILLLFMVICSLSGKAESLVITKAQVRIKNVPHFFIKGTLESIPSHDAETITLTLGPFSQTIALREFKVQGIEIALQRGSQGIRDFKTLL